MDDGYSEDDAADGASQDDSAQQPESAPAPVLIGPAEADHIVDEHGWEEGDALPSEAVLRDAVETVAGDGRQDSDAPEGGLLSLSMPSQEVPEPAQGDDRDAQPGGGEEVSGDDDRGDVDDGHEQEEGEDTDDDGAGRDMDGEDSPEGGLMAVGSKTRRAKAAGPYDSHGYPTKLDPTVDREVAAYNQRHGFKAGDSEYLDPKTVKAMIRVESGVDKYWYENDPMQVNRLKDWGNGEKKKYGLQKGVRPGQELSVQAGIEWLADKAYGNHARGGRTGFLGWDAGLSGYGPKDQHDKNGNEIKTFDKKGNEIPHYLDKVREMEKHDFSPVIPKKSGSSADV